eukprot:6243277-Karenia_brevis.AAC.1
MDVLESQAQISGFSIPAVNAKEKRAILYNVAFIAFVFVRDGHTHNVLKRKRVYASFTTKFCS